MAQLKSHYLVNKLEAGCDEAGRGCLAGPVFAAAVILPPGYTNTQLDDSKRLSAKRRNALRIQIEKEAMFYSVAMVDVTVIDEINILNASILAMHKAIDTLSYPPELLLIDGNRFKKYRNLQHVCIVKGDAKFMSIAAASVLAKTYRDEHMLTLHKEHPVYRWDTNKGYPTRHHRTAIQEYGLTAYHRRTFTSAYQLKMDL